MGRRFALLLALVASAWSTWIGGKKRLQLPQAGYAVVIVLDGARPGYFDPVHLPHLAWLMRHGVTYRQAFVGQELANTPPSHATIGTGVFPRRHGIEGFWWQDPRTHAITRPTDNRAVQNNSLARILTRHRAPSLAASVKGKDRRAKVVAVSGHKCYAAAAMGTASADYILCALIYHGRWVAQAVHDHEPPPGAVNNPHWDVRIPPPSSGFGPAVQQWKVSEENRWTTRYALWAFHTVHYPRVLMVNLPETDVLGHFSGAGKSVMQGVMRSVDRDIGTIIAAYRSAGLLRRTVFVVTADHGMSTVDTRLPYEVLDRAIVLAGATKVYLEADTAAAIGIREGTKARAVARNVAVLGGQIIDQTLYRVKQRGGVWSYRPAYTRPNLPLAMRHALASLADTVASAEGPDVLVFYAPHVTTGDRPVRDYHWLAGHLGPQWDDQHIPLLLAGAGIRSGVESAYPARLVDIAPTLERLLGAPIPPADGVVLADALPHAALADRARQRAALRTLGPEVRALEQRSGAP